MRPESRSWVHTQKVSCWFRAHESLCLDSPMNTHRKSMLLVFGVLAVLALPANSFAQDGPAPGTAPSGPAGPAAHGSPGRSFTPDHPHNLAP
jgi:hypothetical protein